MHLNIDVMRLHDDVQMPERATEMSAAVDLRLYVSDKKDIVLNPGETQLVGTGLKIHINNPGWGAFIFPRSGLGSKGLVLGNGTGVIDADYQGEIFVCLHNRDHTRQFVLKHGERIAQLVFLPVGEPYFTEVEEFAASVRGEGGFGSTGQ